MDLMDQNRPQLTEVDCNGSNGPYWIEMDQSVSQWTKMDCNTTIIWLNKSVIIINAINF